MKQYLVGNSRVSLLAEFNISPVKCFEYVHWFQFLPHLTEGLEFQLYL
jgi:hypothetical protein